MTPEVAALVAELRAKLTEANSKGDWIYVAAINALPALLDAVEDEERCAVERALPHVTENDTALCAEGRYYASLWGEHAPSYHDLAHLYAAQALAAEALKAERDAALALAGRLKQSLAWALRAIGDPPEFTGLFADWDTARALLADPAVAALPQKA